MGLRDMKHHLLESHRSSEQNRPETRGNRIRKCPGCSRKTYDRNNIVTVCAKKIRSIRDKTKYARNIYEIQIRKAYEKNTKHKYETQNRNTKEKHTKW